MHGALSVEEEKKNWEALKKAQVAAVKMVVQENAFQHKQFLLSKAESEYGSVWQKAICRVACVNLDPEKVRRIWDEAGEKQAREALNRKRQNSTQNMHRQFMSKGIEMCDACCCYTPGTNHHHYLLAFLAILSPTPAMMLHREKPPTPKDLLGEDWAERLSVPLTEISEDPVDAGDPSHAAEEGTNVLRNSQEYENFLFFFAKCVLNNDNAKKLCSQPLSSIITVYLEAFLVISYVNKFYVWKSHVEEKSLSSTSTGTTDDLSEVSLAGSTKKEALFTQVADRGGKYRGWSPKGMNVYNKVCEILKKQRLEGDTRLEKRLMERFARAEKIKKAASKKTEASSVDDGLSEWMETLNRCSSMAVAPATNVTGV